VSAGTAHGPTVRPRHCHDERTHSYMLCTIHGTKIDRQVTTQGAALASSAPALDHEKRLQRDLCAHCATVCTSTAIPTSPLHRQLALKQVRETCLPVALEHVVSGQEGLEALVCMAEQRRRQRAAGLARANGRNGRGRPLCNGRGQHVHIPHGFAGSTTRRRRRVDAATACGGRRWRQHCKPRGHVWGPQVAGTQASKRRKHRKTK
jgi:hypothetical protein